MATLISMAKRSMLSDQADAMIYTVSIWTNPDAGVSAISFDTFEDLQDKIRQSNEGVNMHYDCLIAEEEFDEEHLFLPQHEGRSANPS
jgi:hypothetical protein